MRPLILLAAAVLATSGLPSQAVAQNVDWPNVGNDKAGMRYSPLRQIHTRNVGRLEVAWVFHTGDAAPGAGSTIECTPIVVEGMMYVTSPQTKVMAVEAATGQEKWRFDPYKVRYATPCTYSVNGRQFVVIAAGGGGKLGTKSGDSYVAFALPASESGKPGKLR
jgi:glucose dehydrogenase